MKKDYLFKTGPKTPGYPQDQQKFFFNLSFDSYTKCPTENEQRPRYKN